MSGLLNVASGALRANQTLLQTTGNNIANVNTVGYSRQTAVLQTIEGQFTGGGYIGKGVEVDTIQRNYDIFLNRQATLASTTSAADNARATKLNQLENLFPGGKNALGAAVSDMLNAFSDVASSPTDLTARTVALTRINETATRLSSTAASMDELQMGLEQELDQKLTTLNTLATSVAQVNEKIARALGNGQPPNDLLDQRDQLIRDINQYIQTTSIPADDGTIGLFIGGSQALVLGTTAATLQLTDGDFGDAQTSKLAIVRNGQSFTLNEATLGGGEIPGLLRFQNTDLAEARNLLGRYATAVTTSMNDQHKLGLDLDGNVGGDLFTPADFSKSVLAPKAPATLNTGSAVLSLGVADVTQFEASDYEISFASGTTGSITRLSDGKQTAFDFGAGTSITFDGLTLNRDSGAAAAGDRFLLKPFSASTQTISAEFSSARSLAVASPIAGKMGTTNTGSLQLVALTPRTNPPLVETAATPVTLRFISANQYIRSDDANYANYPATIPLPTTHNYVPGTAIEGTVPATSPRSEWSLVLQGTPKAGDTFAVVGSKDAANNNGIDYKINSGNASAMMGLRDINMFDGATLTDGYAGLMAQIGVRAQSASFTAEVSSQLAATLEQNRAAVSGVNLDEEAARLLQYQQAYQASAKVIQVAQGIFDTLIQTIR
ncbi:flagellar hook-associated protein FlgK [Rhodoferax sp. U2-2l]|uniref:flagellar hook-associated protein FlgK n=1 Tax=Rhodoferax sp. U2-2l TaxID=2884000 RepID=UPI001D0BB831|nr:flagellar hook-associated protein FlgK [Rhodoferax sp. U2-2l]MCB8748190.1 flagellar hook-associated protein FlgK [Rhodoferax sp. U2-2l]